MEYQYIDKDPILTHSDNMNIPSARHPIIKLVIDENNSVERPMIYTENVLDDIKSRKAVLSDYEMLIGQGKIFHEYRDTNTDKAYRDDVYMADIICRQDYSITTSEGSAIVDKLEADWTDFIPDYKNRDDNVVSEFTPLRPPYVNNSISYYDMNFPSDDLKSEYGLTYTNYMPWYGLKFDKTTSSVAMKVVITLSEMQTAHSDIASRMEELIPIYGNHFYAVIYNSSKEMNGNIDVYFNASYNVVEKWIEGTHLTIPYTDEDLTPKLWLWGAVYNTELDKITHLKAYIRNYLGD